MKIPRFVVCVEKIKENATLWRLRSELVQRIIRLHLNKVQMLFFSAGNNKSIDRLTSYLFAFSSVLREVETWHFAWDCLKYKTKTKKQWNYITFCYFRDFEITYHLHNQRHKHEHFVTFVTTAHCL